MPCDLVAATTDDSMNDFAKETESCTGHGDGNYGDCDGADGDGDGRIIQEPD